MKWLTSLVVLVVNKRSLGRVEDVELRARWWVEGGQIKSKLVPLRPVP